MFVPGLTGATAVAARLRSAVGGRAGAVDFGLMRIKPPITFHHFRDRDGVEVDIVLWAVPLRMLGRPERLGRHRERAHPRRCIKPAVHHPEPPTAPCTVGRLIKSQRKPPPAPVIHPQKSPSRTYG